jgi:hypothetical protein
VFPRAENGAYTEQAVLRVNPQTAVKIPQPFFPFLLLTQ